MKCHTGTYREKNEICYFWLWLEATRENFWGRHMLCRIFRPIDWYHSLVPKIFFSGVIQDLSPFLESSFWPITRKRLFFSVYFRYWGPIIFQFPIRWPMHFFWGGGGWPFLKTFPIIGIHSPRSPLSLTRSEEIYLFWKTVDNWRRFYMKYSHQNCGWRRDWRRKGNLI